jgi:hypothetical protein
MAYFCLTVVESVFGRRRDASRQLKVEFSVLDMLGNLSSGVGDDQTGRKRNVQQRRPHSPAENDWLDHAVRMLIRRMAEYAFAPAVVLDTITMADLPPLD